MDTRHWIPLITKSIQFCYGKTGILIETNESINARTNLSSISFIIHYSISTLTFLWIQCWHTTSKHHPNGAFNFALFYHLILLFDWESDTSKSICFRLVLLFEPQCVLCTVQKQTQQLKCFTFKWLILNTKGERSLT